MDIHTTDKRQANSDKKKVGPNTSTCFSLVNNYKYYILSVLFVAKSTCHNK